MSRRAAEAEISAGRVKGNGDVAYLGMRISPDIDTVEYKGKVIKQNSERKVYIMLNKPQGVVSATEDNDHKTVIDLVPKELKRDGLFPAGRLDGDTVGFVLITDDGDFAHRILSPKNHIMKTYHATLQRPVTQDDIDAFRNFTAIDTTTYNSI